MSSKWVDDYSYNFGNSKSKVVWTLHQWSQSYITSFSSLSLPLFTLLFIYLLPLFTRLSLITLLSLSFSSLRMVSGSKDCSWRELAGTSGLGVWLRLAQCSSSARCQPFTSSQQRPRDEVPKVCWKHFVCVELKWCVYVSR